MRQSSNPVFKDLDKEYGRYATFGGNAAGGAPQVGRGMAGQYTQGQFPQGGQYPGQPAPEQYRAEPSGRAMTIDDIVTKTAMTLGVLTIMAVISFVLVHSNESLAMPLTFGGMIVGLGLSLFAIFTRRTDKPALVLAYAAAEGVFLGAISYLFANIAIGDGGPPGNTIIIQAVVGTFGVFFGMLVVYKTGAIRVTPKFTKMVVGALFGVLALMVVNLIAGFFMDGGLGLRDGGPIAIIFSLVCIGLAAMSFLIDFDEADKLIRMGAPEKTAWSVSFGLTITLVWLYLEILRLLSYFSSD
ncbi:Bax inhibitor-1/YccA family protein [Tomitella cavernea]|uniref:Bax inhibitor-1/YccA family protein n=1 Tax=Tomitella cavernea TaxID=1387982 RepID=A0ABP9CIS7_9ACTN|nr:Bax inhibitor-1/YccA family protein [Tomitella cavernea]